MKKYKSISLFSGAGGDTQGLEDAGIEVTHFVEIDKRARETHLLNFPNSKAIGEKWNHDITKIPDSEFEKFKGKIDVIFAGFPCQGFSHAGKKDPKDERNKLFYEFLRIVNIVQPRWIIGENVKGLLTKKIDGESYSDVINKEFENIGYSMSKTKLANLSNFGVPQLRQRIFFVGNNQNIDFSFPNEEKEIIGIEDIIKFSLKDSIKINIKEFEYLQNNINWVENKGQKEVVSGNVHPYLLRKLEDKEISFGVRKSSTHVQILDLKKPAKTIHCGYRFLPRLFVLMKQEKDFFIRTLSIEELKKIQTFPENFLFSGKDQDSINQIGNAVPPLMIKKIMNGIIEQDTYFKK